MLEGDLMYWGITIACLLLWAIYGSVKDCLIELKKISMHSRALEECSKATNSTLMFLRTDLEKMDERLRNIETAANLAWDQMRKSEYPANQK